MSEDVSYNNRPRQPFPETAPLQPWSIEQDADALMDDLFDDVDRLLDGGAKLPTKTVKSDYVALESVVVPSLTLPAANSPQSSLAENPTTNSQTTQLQSTQSRSSQGSGKTRHKGAKADPTATGKGGKWATTFKNISWLEHADKIVFGVACVSFVGVVAWLVNEGKLEWPPAFLQGVRSRSQYVWVPISGEDAQFVRYMQRSLEVIETKARSAPPEGSTSPVASGLPAIPGQSPQVVERVYIPIYPPNPSVSSLLPPSPAASPAPQASPSPSPSPQAAPSPPAPPAPSPRAAQSPAPSPSPVAAAPETPAARAGVSRSELPNVPEPEDVASPDAPQASPSPTQTALGNTHKLVGILESGDRTAALFRIGSSTQRITIGETIGESGWTLVDANGQNAIIRRDGEVRSIFVGQSF
ncbi:hypothetical protein K4A83_02280 [Spirulina subsalsa FACHB-351]|uniref:Type II secretion system protein GspC N-terminal domain-containing protein n=1 Tax=Spirulina subsalsa FACHB-351 TaxID=234711 RepID=A0ABT3L0U1_9CYAN|nr:hypothetical protein [Spirulina subsalsa]MCW6035100.1 hypothetical protein [Spirulina subsalsa FACHB-351]